MPGIITHHLLGGIVRTGVPGGLKTIVTDFSGLYNIGTQGPDVFLYYPPCYVTKRVRRLGSRMHASGFKRFFGLAVMYAKGADNPARAALTAYLCGFLTHYALDAAAHPYIYASTSGLSQHWDLETRLDVMALKFLKNQRPADIKPWTLLSVSAAEAELVSAPLSNAINKAYGCSSTDRDIRGAMRRMKQLTYILQSQRGLRKRILSSAECFFLGRPFVSCLIHPQDVDMGVDDFQIFMEMFYSAAETAQKMINAFYGYLNGNITLEYLLQITGDKSFATGLEN